MVFDCLSRNTIVHWCESEAIDLLHDGVRRLAALIFSFILDKILETLRIIGFFSERSDLVLRILVFCGSSSLLHL